MPLFFQNDIDKDTKLAVWKIEEAESFFTEKVPLHRQITHPHKRLQHLAGRYLLQYLFPHFPIGLIQIADTRKPFLADEAFHFSISHCGAFAAVVVSKNRRVGIDIEFVTPKVEVIKTKFLHPQELAQVANVVAAGFDIANETALLTLLWSCKEAVYKWWSFGQVDFSEQIRLPPFRLQPSGSFSAQFLSEKEMHSLALHYRLFDDLCLAWVVT